MCICYWWAPNRNESVANGSKVALPLVLLRKVDQVSTLINSLEFVKLVQWYHAAINNENSHLKSGSSSTI